MEPGHGAAITASRSQGEVNSRAKNGNRESKLPEVQFALKRTTTERKRRFRFVQRKKNGAGRSSDACLGYGVLERVEHRARQQAVVGARQAGLPRKT